MHYKRVIHHIVIPFACIVIPFGIYLYLQIEVTCIHQIVCIWVGLSQRFRIIIMTTSELSTF